MSHVVRYAQILLFSIPCAAVSAATTLWVHDDYGGSVTRYKFRIDALPPHTLVRISGTCASACTMYLGHSNVCVSPDSLFRFHGPSQSGQPLQHHEFELLSQIMATYYPEPLKSRFMSTFRYSIKETVDLRGTELFTLGVATLC